MGDYFKPWRRKIGVLTLLMACVFMAGWARSYLITDVASCSFEGYATDTLVSTESTLLWQRMYNHENERIIFSPDWIAIPTAVPDDSPVPLWRWQFLGFAAGDVPARAGGFDRSAFLRVPYWSTILPLTLLSAWLLLSKPSKLESRLPRRSRVPPF